MFMLHIPLIFTFLCDINQITVAFKQQTKPLGLCVRKKMIFLPPSCHVRMFFYLEAVSANYISFIVIANNDQNKKKIKKLTARV